MQSKDSQAIKAMLTFADKNKKVNKEFKKGLPIYHYY